MRSICGLDCTACSLKSTCHGCNETHGHPFGGSCMIALCCESRGCDNCGNPFKAPCKLKAQLIEEFNALGIKDMAEVTDLNALYGAYINSEFQLPSGQTVKFWDDSRIYLGNQICKKNSSRCYGIAADENHLLVCEYGENGSDAEVVLYKKRR